MNTLDAPSARPTPRPMHAVSDGVPTAARPGPREAEFEELTLAFLRTGGLANGDQTATGLRPGSDPPISRLARWIVARQVLSIDWQGQTLVPLFQFDPDGMTLRPGLPALMQELGTVFDDWELALWFARSNHWLDGAAPADRLADDPMGVRQAARADRFIATGG